MVPNWQDNHRSEGTSIAKQPLPTECFETAFLEYMRLRFEFEPLTHYAMAAIHMCDETGREYPDFVKGFLAWFASSFLFSMKGDLPTQGHNSNPTDARWLRYKDCHDFLVGWLNDDLDEALVRQEAKHVLVEDVEIMRTEDREDHTAADRKRAKSEKPDGVIFGEIAQNKGVSTESVRRGYKKLAEPEEFFSHVAPIALVRCEGGYTVETRQIAKPGAIHFKREKKLRQ